MDIIDRIKGFKTYRYYLAYLKELKSRGLNVRFSSNEFYILSSIFNEYVNFVTLPKKIEEEKISPLELDDIVKKNLSIFFDEDRKRTLFLGLECKNIIKGYATCTTYVDKDGYYIIMNQYQTLSDLANFIHEILHVFIFQTKNPHINSEVMSILFELITRDIIDSLVDKDEYLVSHINTLLDSMLANIKLIELFPKITPVILPYIKAEYLSYELYLVYKNDPQKFIYNLKRILNDELSIEEYLSDNAIIMNEENFGKIAINHKKILTNL